MCGIAGFSGDYDDALLKRMAQHLAHRGPDNEGVFWGAGDRIGLAHRRLAIIDLSPRSNQPMWSKDGSLAVVYNGEIYNYRELRSELASDGTVFNSQSDTEVLLELYRRNGERMLAQLNGIFAFAIWDRVRGQLFIARDNFGVKPLYFAETRRGFLFASELKALLADESLDRTLDVQAVRMHLTYLWCPAPHTMLHAVRKLEPGHAMTIRGGRILRKWCYYELPYSESIAQIDDSAAIEATRTALGRAVERQMVADVPVGAFLSGGLDSSAIVSFAREHTGSRRLQCFTIAFRDENWRREGMTEDWPFAKRVAEHLEVDLHRIDVGPEMAQQFEKMVYQLDEPQADPAALNVLFISRLARQHDIKVLLSGAGGDDIFSGYRRHAALIQEQWWRWWPKPARLMLSELSRHLPASWASVRRFARAFRHADLKEDERLFSYFYWTDPKDAQALYGPILKGERDNSDVLQPLHTALSGLPANTPELNKMLYLEAKYFLADHNLNYTDKMAMAEGVEVRVPFLDPDLVALAARLPTGMKQRGLIGKWVLKKSLESRLPRDVIYRPKTGFGAPIRYWLRNELRPLVDDILSPTALRRRGLFDARAVRALITRDRAGGIDAAYTILSILCIELWCQNFIDQVVH